MGGALGSQLAMALSARLTATLGCKALGSQELMALSARLTATLGCSALPRNVRLASVAVVLVAVCSALAKIPRLASVRSMTVPSALFDHVMAWATQLAMALRLSAIATLDCVATSVKFITARLRSIIVLPLGGALAGYNTSPPAEISIPTLDVGSVPSALKRTEIASAWIKAKVVPDGTVNPEDALSAVESSC